MMRWRWCVVLLLGATAAFGSRLSFDEYRAVQDSLHRLPMRMQSRWLAERGIELPEWESPSAVPTESGGLRMVGKWGRGPAVEVTGRDSLLFLSLGSEVGIINIANPDNPAVLSEVQASGLVLQSVPYDSLLYIGCRQGFSGIEIWNIADPSAPVFRGRVAMRLSAFCVQDRFIYTTTKSSPPFLDTFKVFSLVDPENPQLVGWCRDSGDHIAASGNKVVLGDWGSVHVMDVSDRANPHRVGDIGVDALGLDMRGNLVCAAEWWNGKADDFWFDVFDITDPTSPRLLSQTRGVGGYDIHLSGSLAFVSGFYYDWEFTIVNLSDSTRPSVISTCTTPGWNDAVWADRTSNRAYVADDDRGLTVVDITNLNNPVINRSLFLAAGLAVDVSLCDTLMYVATWTGGMQIVNVADPTRPVSVAEYDSVGYHSWEGTVLANDSFAYVGDSKRRPFRVLDVTDPLHPQLAGYPEQGSFNPAEAMALRDSFVYCAEYARFQVVNVARPREPVIVGNCVLAEEAYGLCLVDTLAFVANYPFAIVNVSVPASPTLVGTIGRGAWNCSVRDDFLFLSSGGVVVYEVSDPAHPRLADSISLGPNTYWVEAVGSLLYTGNRDGVHVVDAGDVHDMRARGFSATPHEVYRLRYVSPHVYAACWDAGVCIFESTQVGVEEPSPSARRQVSPKATVMRATGWNRLVGGGTVVFDATGRRVTQAKPGVYFIREGLGTGGEGLGRTQKVVVTR